MKPFEKEFILTAQQADPAGNAKLSALLYLCQEAAGGHCLELGLDWDSLQKKGLFWALIRVGMEITRLPVAGEPVKMRTWPMPTTRTAFPRAAEGYDREGNLLFRATSLWVLMDTQKRTMLLPGKSDVGLNGIVLGQELPGPGSLPPQACRQLTPRAVTPADIDRNGHVNNTRYMDWLADLAPDMKPVKAFSACYLSEALPGQTLSLGLELTGENGCFEVLRSRPEQPEKPERIFAAKVEF